jgi:N-acetylglucosamine-6-phosphate deacetylase
MTKHAIAARYIFDSEILHDNAAVIIDGNRIDAVVPRADVPSALPVRDLPEDVWLVPGFIDIQVNGGGDVLFNDAPTPETIRKIVAAHRRFGTTALLPTLISDTPAKMKAALAAVDALLGVESAVLGIHLEGPFLSPEKRGVHDARALRRPSADDIAMLAAPRQGVTLVTLAPEQVPHRMIAKLTGAGVRVALGHSLATYAQTLAAMAEGLTGFTHLFNAMRGLGSREPGPIAAALESADAFYSLIVDGVHVAPAMLRLALRGAGNPILVTDAMPPVGGAQTSFTLAGEKIVVQNGRCAKEDGTLAGAYLDMATAIRNCVRLLNVPLTEALRFASTNPAQFLRLDDRLGRLAPGYRADLVALDSVKIAALQTWIAGQLQ